MAEYIERDRLVETLTDIIDDYKEERTFSTDFAATVVADILSDVVKSQPVADVAPVRNGREKRSGPLLECNQCGEIYSQLGGNSGKSWNYCPNCGADMRGDGNA